MTCIYINSICMLSLHVMHVYVMNIHDLYIHVMYIHFMNIANIRIHDMYSKLIYIIPKVATKWPSVLSALAQKKKMLKRMREARTQAIREGWFTGSSNKLSEPAVCGEKFKNK